MREFLNEIQTVIAETNIESSKKIIEEALQSGVDPEDIVDAMSRGLGVVGEKYAKGEYFLSNLIMAGIMAKEIMAILKPFLRKSAEKPIGKVVIGTAKGDLHDIGKNIVVAFLSSTGFEVVDLGIDVPSEKFVDAVRKEKPDILAISCLLTIAMDEMRRVVDELKEANLRGQVKVMVGGRPITRDFADEIGSDAYGEDAVEAVRLAKSLILEAR